MTEGLAHSHVTTDTHRDAGQVGLAAAGVEVRIADDGEILIKSPGQLVGWRCW